MGEFIHKQISEAVFKDKLVLKMMQLVMKIKEDELIFGDAYVHFTERGIEVLDPSTVILNYKKRKDWREWRTEKR